jgi:hypothetical protein
VKNAFLRENVLLFGNFCRLFKIPETIRSGLSPALVSDFSISSKLKTEKLTRLEEESTLKLKRQLLNKHRGKIPIKCHKY